MIASVCIHIVSICAQTQRPMDTDMVFRSQNLGQVPSRATGQRHTLVACPWGRESTKKNRFLRYLLPLISKDCSLCSFTWSIMKNSRHFFPKPIWDCQKQPPTVPTCLYWHWRLMCFATFAASGSSSRTSVQQLLPTKHSWVPSSVCGYLEPSLYTPRQSNVAMEYQLFIDDFLI